MSQTSKQNQFLSVTDMKKAVSRAYHKALAEAKKDSGGKGIHRSRGCEVLSYKEDGDRTYQDPYYCNQGDLSGLVIDEFIQCAIEDFEASEVVIEIGIDWAADKNDWKFDNYEPGVAWESVTVWKKPVVQPHTYVTKAHERPLEEG